MFWIFVLSDYILVILSRYSSTRKFKYVDVMIKISRKKNTILYDGNFQKKGRKMFSLVFTAFDRGSRHTRDERLCNSYSNWAHYDPVTPHFRVSKRLPIWYRFKIASAYTQSGFRVYVSISHSPSPWPHLRDQYWILSFTIVTRISYDFREILEYV